MLVGVNEIASACAIGSKGLSCSEGSSVTVLADSITRRRFVWLAALAGGSLALGGCAGDGSNGADDSAGEGAGESQGPEDAAAAARAAADERIGAMTLEQKVAQLFIVTPEALVEGVSQVTRAGDMTREGVAAHPVGGIVYFAQNLLDPEQRAMAAVQLIGKMPGLVAMTYKYSVGEPYIYPRNDLSYSANFMRMMFAIPCEEYKINDVLTRAIDRIFILHADHEQNASTSTVRLCASSGTSPFAAIAAGVACLWGPQHGGANEATLSMLYHIQEEGGIAKIGDFIKKVKDKSSGVRLMGFGHRVYKNYDPRAKLMRETCYEVLDELGLHDSPIFKLALALEKIALEDEYFISRNLYPNVDFYSGIVQKAIGIPMPLFTAIFAMARTVGWFAQLNEMIDDPAFRIGRPRQLFTGCTERHVKPIEER